MIFKSTLLAVLAILMTACTRTDDAWKLDPHIQNKCLAVLRAGMKSEEFWPSIHAAEGLTVAGYGTEVQDYLASKLPLEKDDQRRCGIARELFRAGDREKSEVMVDILNNEDPHGHVHAAESLYKVGWDGNDDALQKAFQEPDDVRLRLMAAAALAKFNQGAPGKEAFSFLRENLQDEPDPAIFRISAWVLARIGEDSDKHLIRSRMNDADDELVHAFLEHALAALGDEEGREALLQNLESEDSVIRTYAAVFAGEAKIFDAAPLITAQLNDENLDARIRAAQSLLTLAL